jgi:hypothetical protein
VSSLAWCDPDILEMLMVDKILSSSQLPTPLARDPEAGFGSRQPNPVISAKRP